MHWFSMWLYAEDEITDSLSSASPCASQATSVMDDDQEKHLLSPFASKGENVSFVKEAPLKLMSHDGGEKHLDNACCVGLSIWTVSDWSLKIAHFSKAYCIPHSFSGFRFVSGLIQETVPDWFSCIIINDCVWGLVVHASGFVFVERCGALCHVNFIQVWKWVMEDSLHVAMVVYEA